jgi:adenylosuccinate synthase
MAVVAVVGAQWGDEGKGKVIDTFGPSVELIVHFAGGSQLGQSIAVAGERLVFDLLPSGPLREGRACMLAQGMAISPRLLIEERDTLEQHGILNGELLVCHRAHVVLPHHELEDELRAEAEGASGAPRRGIGPCYADKLGRRGVQIGDLLAPDAMLAEKVEASMAASAPVIQQLGGEVPDVRPVVESLKRDGERIAPMMVDGSRRVADQIKWGGDVILEAPLGTMVDLDMGSYPYVVAANTTAAGACVGTGLAPAALDAVLGVAKVYTTRAGSGPFPTELAGDLAQVLRERGGEIGARSGKPRRIGMFDVPAIRFAARVNGFTMMALTKLDVLTGLAEIPVCVGYELDGELVDEPPFAGQSRIKPHVEMRSGWTDSIEGCRTWDDLPMAARDFVRFLEEKCELEVGLVGVGSDRAATIVRNNPFG